MLRHLAIALTILISASLMRSAHSASAEPPTVAGGLGLGVAWQQGEAFAAESIGLLEPSVWSNWVYSDDCMADIRCYPMVFALADDGWSRQAMEAAQVTPGRLWLLGNEPEIGATLTDPVAAAVFTRAWSDEVGGLWACCGTIAYDPSWSAENWQAWLDAYLEAGGAIPSHWHIHIYWVQVPRWYPEILRFRAWAAEHGIERPIIVSETAVPWAGAGYNAALLDEVALRLATDPDLVSVLWYSAHDWFGTWPTTNLIDDDGTLTVVGQRFVALQIAATGKRTWQMYVPLVAK